MLRPHYRLIRYIQPESLTQRAREWPDEHLRLVEAADGYRWLEIHRQGEWQPYDLPEDPDPLDLGDWKN